MARPALRVLFGILLVASLGANLYLGLAAVEDYREHCLTRVGPARLVDPVEPHEPADIVYFGDSRIAAWTPLPAAPGWSAANAGVGGETTGMVLDRLQVDVLDRSPKIVVLQVGVNDLKVIGLYPDRAARVLAACEANIKAIVSAITASGARVLLLTVLPAGDSVLRRWFLWAEEADAAVERLNRSLLAFDSDGVMVVDVAREMGAGGRLQSSYSADFLHLNARGYERLSEIVQGPLEGLVSR